MIRSAISGISCVLLTTFLVFADGPIEYLRDVKPLLHERCYACHGVLAQESGLRLDTAALVLRGGAAGPASVPGDADKSLLIKRVTEADPESRMPLEGQPLTMSQIAVLRTWIDGGAEAPKDESLQDDPRQHWAFQPLRRPMVPAAGDKSTASNPIDTFIETEFPRRGMTPVPLADKLALQRRVSLDLVGLAPTREQLHRFQSDHPP